MKKVIKRKNKTRFDYFARYLGVFSIVLFIMTLAFINPSTKKIVASNKEMEQSNTILSRENNDLIRDYHGIRNMIRNITD